MKKSFLTVAAALLTLVGCTNEEIMNAPVMKGKVQASLENSASRLAVGNGNILTWSGGDAFVMFNEAGESATWTLEGTGGTEEGTFGTTDELGGILMGAAFPASTNPVLQDDKLAMTLPTTLKYKESICNLPMWASFESLDASISFKHLGALLKINFSEIPAGYNTLTVTADKPLAGVFTADLSKEEPVLAAAEQGAENSVKITFDASTSKQDKMFYIPLPVGTYASINVSVSDGTNTLSIADWANRTIERKKVYLASLTYKTSTATTTAGINADLGETKTVTLAVTEKVTDVTEPITLPANSVKVGLNFAQVPATTEATPLVIEESEQAEDAELNVSIPASQTADSYLTLEVPNTTVTVESGTYKRITAHTAANTLVLGEDVEVEELVILGGNVKLEGGVVTGSIVRHADNADAMTYVYVKNVAELESVTLGEGVKAVSSLDKTDYLTFAADAEQTFSLTKAVETLEYSVGDGEWIELGTSVVTFGGNNGNLRLRGKSAIGTTVSNNNYSSVKFGNTLVYVTCTGDIRTLVDYENYDSDELDTSNARFCQLFFNCPSLTSVPKLPATVLADYCYQRMFYNCINLKEATELPATVLTDYCYNFMFARTSITKVPELPATTLAKGCYNNMFSYCTGINKTPELPATTLADYCYGGMFAGTSITEAPKLPITTLTPGCYSGMFSNCTALTQAPELPATTLVANCYQSMFSGCTGLTEVPELPAPALVDYCYSGMFSGCTGLTQAPELPITTLAPGCYQNMFANCTGLTQAPELPATTLVEYCYDGLFSGCTGLTQAPVLPATTLADYCYSNMFRGCTNLKEAPLLPVTTLAKYCYSNMFDSCTSLTQTPTLPATALADYCYSYMFRKCTGLTKAPELSVTSLVKGCYSGMFEECTGLTEAPVLPATTMVDYCYSNMFRYCSSLTKAPELPSMTLATGCYNAMFQSCTNLTEAPELPATTLANLCYIMMFTDCKNLTKAPVLHAETLTSACYNWIFRNCSKLNEVTMLATTLTENCVNEWLVGTAATGTFYKAASVEDVSAYQIPEGWEVKDAK